MRGPEKQAETVLLDAYLILGQRSRTSHCLVGDEEALRELFGLYRLKISRGSYKVQALGISGYGRSSVISSILSDQIGAAKPGKTPVWNAL